MNILSRKCFVIGVAVVLLSACAGTAKPPEGASIARSKLTELQSDPQLASRAPLAVQEAERAVINAEKPQNDTALANHLALMADRKVEIASAQAHTRLYEEQRETLANARQNIRLDSRTREADRARNDANNARVDAGVAQQKNSDLQAQIIALNAKNTERGLVVTLGDLLFDTGTHDLKAGAEKHLNKLAVFLNKYTDSTVIIEGHTDSIGGSDANFSLSQRRATAVQSWLISQGVSSSRLTTLGKGEGAPIAGNDSASGRQQNRRVEVIIVNTSVSSR